MGRIETLWTDDELLKLMRLRETEELTFKQISDKLSRSRGSCIGAYSRIIKDLEASEK